MTKGSLTHKVTPVMW